MRGIRLSADLTLPVDAATGTFGVLATKGAGKSNAAVTMAERMYDAGVPWVAVDPKGDWYGVRSSADGKGPGLPVIVFGGRHGDVDLEPTGGVLIADLVLRHRLTCVLDVSQFTKADTTRFLLAFGRHLFAHADDDGAEPLHLFLEEAHEYLPQVVKGDQAELVNVWQRIVKQGRFKGLGCTLISQRSSVLNKDVLELIDTLIVLRTIGPRSRQSIKDWVQDQDVDPGLLASLPGLADGEAWVWSPGALRILKRIQFDRRRTFDSGATPKVGEKRRTPSTLADVDLAAIKEAMAETIERAKADDPRELRKRIAQLERDLAAERAKPQPEPVTTTVPMPVIDTELVARLQSAIAPAYNLMNVMGDALTAHHEWLIEQEAQRGRQDVPRARPASHRPDPVERQGPAQRPDPTPRREPSRPPVPRAEAATDLEQGDLSKAHRALLSVLAQHGVRNDRQLGVLSGYSHKSGHFGNILANLRSRGFAVGTRAALQITDAGRAALGPVDELPAGQALLDYWYGRLDKAQAALLRALVEAWPNSLSDRDLEQITGYSRTSGHFGNSLARLRSLELASGTRAAVTADDTLGSAHA